MFYHEIKQKWILIHTDYPQKPYVHIIHSKMFVLTNYYSVRNFELVYLQIQKQLQKSNYIIGYDRM